jgi:hypothetical protein
MEELLMTWIEDQTQKCIHLSTMMITITAKSLFVMLKEKAGPEYNVEFTASPGCGSNDSRIVIHYVM